MPSGGKRDGSGRPFGSKNRKPTREITKQIRWTAAEWAEVEHLADKANITPSEYIRGKALNP